MANYEISLDEYRRWTQLAVAKPWKRNLRWAICFIILAVSLFFAQYAFSLIWGAILVFFYVAIYRMTPRMNLNRLTNNPFARGPFDVEFQDEVYVFRVKDSVLELSVPDIGRVHDYDEYFRIDHKSHFSLSVPKRALSEEELGIVESYWQSFPGQPEDTTIPDF